MRISLFFLFIFLHITSFSQDFFTWDGGRILTLDNGVIKREINYTNDNVYSSGLFLKGHNNNFINKNRVPEFDFLLDDKRISEYDGGWKIISFEPLKDNLQGKGVTIKIQRENTNQGLELEINYLLYPGLPVIRKWITFSNNSEAEKKIEALDIEKLDINGNWLDSWIYHDYARMKQIGMNFLGNWDDPLVVVHNHSSHSGIAFGNEAPGVLKRTAYNLGSVEVGMTHPGQDHPFRKWLKPGEKWASPKTFIAVYAGTDNGSDVVNTGVNDFVRKHMGTRISENNKIPTFAYNTWDPFGYDVHEKNINELAMASADCGIREFIIDDGWQTNKYDNRNDNDRKRVSYYGDWLVDTVKFPNGLKPVIDNIKNLGMKPGVWISVAMVNNTAEVFIKHPDWLTKGRDGRTSNLYSYSEDYKTACLATGWTDYFQDVVVKLIKDYGLTYIKFDFSIVTGAYISDPKTAGCYATDHPGHKDHEESYIAIYENCFKLFDALHAAAPNLYIDCTYETTGKAQLMDYAFAQHADGNWLSNFNHEFPTGALRVRQMAWWRSPVLPASSLVIGNLYLNSKNNCFDIKSLVGTLPIVLSDARLVPEADRTKIKIWADWLAKMQDKYNYMLYRQDLPGFGEPQEGAWDGWQRINTDTKTGGIVGVFRQGAVETSRIVIVTGLDSKCEYAVKYAVTGKNVVEMTGDDLLNKGFMVELKNKYDAEIFEITLKSK